MLIARRTAAWLAAMLALTVAASPVRGQDKKKAPERLPQPEVIEFESTDYITMACTYYPSNLGKEAVPVILLHGWGSRASELESLAGFLQAQGHAVFVPDLRAHGKSAVRKAPGVAAEDLKHDELKALDYSLLVTWDFLALKKELLTRHNSGEFNIDWLTLVGIDVGSIVAMNWAALDWSQPDLPTIKIGRDVKALVLVSPEFKHKSIASTAAMKNPNVMGRLSIMLVGGVNDRKSKTEFDRYSNAFERFHKPPRQLPNEDDQEFARRALKERSFFPEPEDTTLQGNELISAPNLNVAKKIAAFIKLRVVDQAAEKNLPPWHGERRTQEKIPR